MFSMKLGIDTSMTQIRRGGGALAALALACLCGTPPLLAAELLMLEQPGCPWCERWDREIGPTYGKTAAGRRAPLRRVDITQPWPGDLKGIQIERFTPTFILVEGRKEIARLRGYPGDSFFWPLVDEMLEKLPEETPAAGRGSGHGR